MPLSRDPVTLEIVDLHSDGYGVDVDGRFRVFGVLPEETVVVEPFTRRRRQTYAHCRAVQTPSVDRVVPVCSAADRCGGCSFQHVDPLRQILFKQAQLIEALGDRQPLSLLPPLMGPVSGYRSKARLGVKYVAKKGQVLVGFREKMSPYIAEIERCEVLASPVGDIVEDLAALVGSLSNKASIPQIEVAVGDSGTALVFRHLVAFSAEDTSVLESFSRDRGIAIYLQPGNPETVWKLCPADGNERLTYDLPEHDIQMSFHPLDFIQVNRDINRKMLDLTQRELSPQAGDRVLDLFCGIGNFSLPLARKVDWVVGIELAESSVSRARENASANRIDNCTFVVADLTRDDVMLPLQGVNKVVLDPPRSGALSVCKALASHKVDRVVYVSCNPLTLARDAGILLESGYRMNKAGVIDMFPHTTHVESIAVFSAHG